MDDGSTQSNSSEGLTPTSAAIRPITSSTSSNETQRLSNNGSDVHPVPPLVFPAQNGTHSSKGSRSTLIPSSVLSITSTALTKASDVLDLLKYSLGDPSPLQKLKRVASGPQLSTSLSKRHCSYSPTGMRNSGSMETTSRNCFQQNQSPFTLNYSSTTKQSGTKSDKGRMSYLPIEGPSQGITKQLSPQTVLELKARAEEARQVKERAENH
jgi:hypothetical protein